MPASLPATASSSAPSTDSTPRRNGRRSSRRCPNSHATASQRDIAESSRGGGARLGSFGVGARVPVGKAAQPEEDRKHPPHVVFFAARPKMSVNISLPSPAAVDESPQVVETDLTTMG